MIAKRIIPLFLLKGQRLVKGTGFRDFVDVGDPVSQAMVYDAQGADEIIVVDITASAEGRLVDEKLINRMIYKCRLPIGVGGGIRTVEDAKKYFDAGADKIVVNTYAALKPGLVKELAGEIGSQSIVVSIDIKRDRSGKLSIYIFSGRQKTELNPAEYIRKVIEYGAGEIMLTSIDKEGGLQGLDYDLYKEIRNLVSVPLLASGGAGCYDDIVRLFQETDSDACVIGKILFLRDYDIVRIKSYLKGKQVIVREA